MKRVSSKVRPGQPTVLHGNDWSSDQGAKHRLHIAAIEVVLAVLSRYPEHGYVCKSHLVAGEPLLLRASMHVSMLS